VNATVNAVKLRNVRRRNAIPPFCVWYYQTQTYLHDRTPPLGRQDTRLLGRAVLAEFHRLDDPSELLKIAADHHPRIRGLEVRVVRLAHLGELMV